MSHNHTDELAAILRGDDGESSGFLAIELLSHITLPLIIVFALAAQLTVANQGAVVQDTLERVKQLENTDRYHLIIELLCQRLIRASDHVVQVEVIEGWRLRDAEPATSIIFANGLPADEQFKHLCASAVALSSERSVVDRLYVSVLEFQLEPSDAPVLDVKYNGLHVPDGLRGPNIIGLDDKSNALRDQILHRLRGHVALIRRRVETIQAGAVERALRHREVVEQVRAPDPDQTRDNIRQLFHRAGYELLPSAF